MGEHQGAKQVAGIWFPEHEQHMVQWIGNRMREHPKEMIDGKGTYQYHKLKAAVDACSKNRRVAVDVGAHVGLWSMHLVKLFEYVHAFEPIKIHRACFARNVPEENWKHKPCYTLYPIALGDHAGTVTMTTTEGSSGDSKVSKDDGDITLKRLDDVLDFPGCVDADKVDFVKVDCEGYELFALKGGEELIKRCRPVVCVEQKPGYARRYGMAERGAVDWLKELGAVQVAEIGGDFILRFPEVA